jgi:AcrR family transcriptional regulator
MNEKSEAVTLDGRRQRGERSRQAIIDAALAIITEGQLAPTAQLISERAGITIRSFFRHFSDMESLFRAVNEHVRKEAVGTFSGGDQNGSLAERILHVVERYTAGYEQSVNVILMTKAQSWRYQVLRENYARLQEELRKNLEHWLPEIKALPATKRELAHAATSFEMWHRLREQQSLGQAKILGTMVDVLSGLLSEC